MKRIYGSYKNFTEAGDTIKGLSKQGYKQNQIILLSKNTMEEITQEDKVQWSEIKDTFIFRSLEEQKNKEKDNEINKKLLEKYSDNINSDELIILLEGTLFGEGVPDWDEREREFYEDLDE